jgi:hypothetical protein
LTHADARSVVSGPDPSILNGGERFVIGGASVSAMGVRGFRRLPRAGASYGLVVIGPVTTNVKFSVSRWELRTSMKENNP